jgi:hypothetical protein
MAGASLLTCHLAVAGIESPAESLDEIVVTGERAGPGLWHVYKGAAQPGAGDLYSRRFSRCAALTRIYG